MTHTLIASRRHTGVTLAIVAAIAIAGLRQGASLAASPADVSRVLPYLLLVALQLLWVRFTSAGLKAAGHSLSELTGGRWSSAGDALTDVLWAAAVFLIASTATTAVSSALGGAPPNTAFLLPYGMTESVVWVLVSVTAAMCEEIVFRGYLQRQLAALTKSAAAGIVLQAIAFGVSHGYQGAASIATTGLYGLLLGLLAWWRGNIRACALVHATTDIIGGLARF
jgi:membrane protease YdiL (CAAX protease family)